MVFLANFKASMNSLGAKVLNILKAKERNPIIIFFN